MVHGSITDNLISGNAGNDTLVGSYGDDTINGGAGNDILYGDDIFVDILTETGLSYAPAYFTSDPDTGDTISVTADNLAYGVNGQDTFVFEGNWGQDSVMDFELGNDILDLSSTGLTYDDLTISTLMLSELFPDSGITSEVDATYGSIGTEITNAEGDSIFLLGVDLADLTLAHFDFG